MSPSRRALTVSTADTAATDRERRWTVGELPTGTVRCLEARGDGPVQVLVEFPDRHRALVTIDVPVNREGLAHLLEEGNRPVAVLLIRQDAALTARIIAISQSSNPRIQTDLGTALACLESGIHGTLRC